MPSSVIIPCQEIEPPHITHAKAVEKQPFLKGLVPCPPIKDTLSRRCPLAVFMRERSAMKPYRTYFLFIYISVS
jgi:hypothetical protein